MEQTPQNILHEAASLIENHGFCKEIQQDEEGRLCIIGAIVMAGNGTPYSRKNHNDSGIETATEEAQKALQMLEAALNTYDAAIWNNQPERTKEEVVSALRNVAEGKPVLV